MDGKSEKWHLLSFISSAAMLCVPILVRERFENLRVDGLVSVLDLNDFVDVFIGQNAWQMTLVSTIPTQQSEHIITQVWPDRLGSSWQLMPDFSLSKM